MRISLFIPCLADTVLPEIGEATARLLSRLGHDLDYPAGQTCCGQPAFNAGHWDDARRVADNFLRAFAGAETIVCPSGSCVSMVRNRYPLLFADDPGRLTRAREIGSRTYELCEFLVRRLGVVDVGAVFEGTVGYHASCHLLRELGVREEPLQLLRAVRGLTLAPMEDSERCCGFGGIFSVKHPEVSAAMADRKVRAARLAGVEVVAAADPGCLIHLRGRFHRLSSPVRLLHVAEVLAGP